MTALELVIALCIAAFVLFGAVLLRAIRFDQAERARKQARDDAQWADLMRRVDAENAASDADPYRPTLVGCFIGDPNKDLTADVRRAWEQLS